MCIRDSPESAYTPEARTFTNVNGQAESITIYRLRPEFVLLQDRVITNVPQARSNYNGVQFDMHKRMSNRWQMLAGLSRQEHRGFDHSGTYTGIVFSNPNVLINRDDGSVFTDLPWAFTLSGSYLLPRDVMVSGKYTARAGDPQVRTFVFTGLPATQVSETVRVQQRGIDRTEDVTKFVDIRFSKRVRSGPTSWEPTLDIFNLLNANHVLEATTGIGTTWGRPSRVLAPRIIRFGLTARF
jgi:hypothetical protein